MRSLYKADQKTRLEDGTIERSTNKLHALFDTSIDLKTDRYLSEDYTFCRRWQSLGGKIWIDPTVVLTHHGSYSYQGYSIFTARQGQQMKSNPYEDVHPSIRVVLTNLIAADDSYHKDMNVVLLEPCKSPLTKSQRVNSLSLAQVQLYL
jgi:hypothetical protein